MLKHFGGKWTMPSSHVRLSNVFSNSNPTFLRTTVTVSVSIDKALKFNSSHPRVSETRCGARSRRGPRYDDDDEEDGEEGYGYNEEIAMLESYTLSARDEVLLVRALLDKQEVEVLIFKGFSSSLSHRTSPDPSTSVLPARAVIKSIDRIRGPFDPSNIGYIEKDIEWNAFKARLAPT